MFAEVFSSNNFCTTLKTEIGLGDFSLQVPNLKVEKKSLLYIF